MSPIYPWKRSFAAAPKGYGIIPNPCPLPPTLHGRSDDNLSPRVQTVRSFLAHGWHDGMRLCWGARRIWSHNRGHQIAHRLMIKPPPQALAAIALLSLVRSLRVSLPTMSAWLPHIHGRAKPRNVCSHKD